MALTAALALAGDNAISMKIHMPDSKGWMELGGQLAWRSESGKTAGIAFVGLTEDSRQRIREWLAAETSEREPRSPIHWSSQLSWRSPGPALFPGRHRSNRSAGTELDMNIPSGHKFALRATRRC